MTTIDDSAALAGRSDEQEGRADAARSVDLPLMTGGACGDPAVMGRVRDLLGADLFLDVSDAFGQMDWAEEEIQQAQARHPDRADELYHSFSILLPSDALLGTEFVVRSHYRELLNRVAAGQDTRLPTAAEIASVCSRMSQDTKLNLAAMTLYIRVWQRAFPDKAIFGEDAEHYEYIAHDAADRLEWDCIRTLTDPDRLVRPRRCQGRHWGERVDCRFRVSEELVA